MAEKRAPDWVPTPGRALLLRTCQPGGVAWGGFVWPQEGFVGAPDWSSSPTPGDGLHGLMWGAGAGVLLDWRDEAVWVVAEVDEASAIDLGGKVKVPSACVIYMGTMRVAIDLVCRYAPRPDMVVGGQLSHSLYADAGWRGRAESGDAGRSTSGWRGLSLTGAMGTATVGDLGRAESGDGGVAVAGWRGIAIAGQFGRAVSGDYGYAEAGESGHALVGYFGSAKVGSAGLAVSRRGGLVAGGPGATIVVGDTVGWVSPRGDYDAGVFYEVGTSGFVRSVTQNPTADQG